MYLGQILAARLVARKLVRPGLIAGDRVGDQEQLVALDLLGEFHRLEIRVQPVDNDARPHVGAAKARADDAQRATLGP